MIDKEKDPGSHYRREYKGIKLDPARIAKIYDMSSPMLFTVLKKILRAGNGGHKDYNQDLLDCQDALRREIEIINEDLEYKVDVESNDIDIKTTTLWGM